MRRRSLLGRQTAAPPVDPIPYGNLVSYLAFEDNLNDSKSVLSATGTGLIYVAPMTGTKSADFNGATSFIEIADNDVISFTDGVSDTPFTFSFMIEIDNVVSAQQLFIKRDSSNAEYFVKYEDNGNLTIHLYDSAGVSNRLQLVHPTGFVSGQKYHLAILYDGSETAAGLKIAIDKVIQGTASMIGTYTGMGNTSKSLIIGKNNIDNKARLNGRMDGLALWDKALSQVELNAVFDKQFTNGQELI